MSKPSSSSSRDQELQILESKINQLKEKRDLLKRKSAELLLQKCEVLCGKEFSLELILGLLSDTFKDATPEQKEAWIHSGRSFLQTRVPQKKVV